MHQTIQFLHEWKVEHHEDQGTFLHLKTNAAEVRIYVLTDEIIRVRASFNGNFEEESYSLVLTAWKDRLDHLFKEERRRIDPVPIDVHEGKNRLLFETANLKIEIIKSLFQINILTKDGQILHQDVPGKCLISDHLGRKLHYFRKDESDKFYGFGEVAGPLNKAKRRVRLSPKDAYGYDPEHASAMYKHVPWMIRVNPKSGNAIGTYYHTQQDCEFDLGAEVSGYFRPFYSYFQCDGGNDLDIFYVWGSNVKEIVKNFAALVGKPCMPPLYSLGYQGSTMYYTELPKDCDKAVQGFVEKCKQEQIPVDMFNLSSGYSSGSDGLRYIFNWDKNRFPDVKGWFKSMKSQGVIVCPNVKPGMLITHSNYGEFKDLFIQKEDSNPFVGYWWGGPGSYIDFTNEKAREKYGQMLKANYLDHHCETIWNDNNEYDQVEPNTICYNEGKPTPSQAIKTAQSLMMSYTTKEVLMRANHNLRPFIVSRSGCAGIQRYAQIWAGDNATSWASLKFNMATMLNSGLSGLINTGCDVGGFVGPRPTEELFVRWVQNGIFTPRFSIHSCNDDNTVTEPWMYPNVTGIIRNALKLRYQLIPYLYSLMRKAAKTGLPIIRPMFLEFPCETAAYDNFIDFMFGPFLLVANVVEEGARKRDIAFPNGSWRDFFQPSECHVGKVTVAAPLDKCLLFLRPGAIVPLSLDQHMLNLSLNHYESIQILLYPVASCKTSFTLYEDDGTSNEFERGVYRETEMTLSRDNEIVSLSFSVSGSYASRLKHIELKIVSPKGALWVRLEKEKDEGAMLPMFLDPNNYETSSSAWMYDCNGHFVRIKYPFEYGNHKVIVSFDRFDLLGIPSEDVFENVHL